MSENKCESCGSTEKILASTGKDVTFYNFDEDEDIEFRSPHRIIVEVCKDCKDVDWRTISLT
jgi:hypothetical protein